ncbi:hypothetical protein GJ654_09675 [Rhodoblastus acidophilus]|uniref:Uncharacterized protein n=1 Tax=Rhodoblastus acidophilus TaxID=1074 RepID=A0A6N8DPY8_RHOAC|nr:hypothetical protein [Rhodoblastus acidophilus]MCW2274283.1 hypothetical protein [Rhodoblastus acidophilus]MTV31263.1 hypothetical protein [Rhodoblastus acidophilus]
MAKKRSAVKSENQLTGLDICGFCSCFVSRETIRAQMIDVRRFLLSRFERALRRCGGNLRVACAKTGVFFAVFRRKTEKSTRFRSLLR